MSLEATDPSPGPPRLVKAPAAGHPLPAGEGWNNLERTALSLWERGDREAVGEGYLVGLRRSLASVVSKK